MLKLYAGLAIIGIIGVGAWGAKYYYDTTQATISTLRQNNAQLEVAVQTSEDTINVLNKQAAKNAIAAQELQNRLQVAESYGDSLRRKLRQLDLVQDAITDPKDLEGRMNGATAKIWRQIMDDTGNDTKYPLPIWLQRDTGTRDQSSNTDAENNSTDSGSTETR